MILCQYLKKSCLKFHHNLLVTEAQGHGWIYTDTEVNQLTFELIRNRLSGKHINDTSSIYCPLIRPGDLRQIPSKTYIYILYYIIFIYIHSLYECMNINRRLFSGSFVVNLAVGLIDFFSLKWSDVESKDGENNQTIKI